KVSEKGVKFKSHIDGTNFEMTPESSMQDQWKIGADIHMAFDHLAKCESYEDMKEAMERTHRWLDRCITEHRKLSKSATSTGDGPGGGPLLSASEVGEEKVRQDPLRI
ncbi:tRNA-guanine transglycosylase, partial [Ralstonia pseudosolanacearum]|uniref:tRNA-guanine transglycosylase n=1 Tax=Ralstonia pseudosolanacearum TaxID=1310165 RepID=UPI003D16FBF7